MTDIVELRSAERGRMLTFATLGQTKEGIKFECKYVSTSFYGAIQSSTYLVEPPSRFFGAMAADWRLKREWQDFERSLILRSKGDALGHIFLDVEIRDHASEEGLFGSIQLELGQLDAIAGAMRRLFGFDTLAQHTAWLK